VVSQNPNNVLEFARFARRTSLTLGRSTLRWAARKKNWKDALLPVAEQTKRPLAPQTEQKGGVAQAKIGCAPLSVRAKVRGFTCAQQQWRFRAVVFVGVAVGRTLRRCSNRGSCRASAITARLFAAWLSGIEVHMLQKGVAFAMFLELAVGSVLLWRRRPNNAVEATSSSALRAAKAAPHCWR